MFVEQYVTMILIVRERVPARMIVPVVKFVSVAREQVFVVMVAIGVPRAKYTTAVAVPQFLQLITVMRRREAATTLLIAKVQCCIKGVVLPMPALV
jgi:hypothetical protein